LPSEQTLCKKDRDLEGVCAAKGDRPRSAVDLCSYHPENSASFGADQRTFWPICRKNSLKHISSNVQNETASTLDHAMFASEGDEVVFDGFHPSETKKYYSSEEYNTESPS
jgi:hypothetical protein